MKNILLSVLLFITAQNLNAATFNVINGTFEVFQNTIGDSGAVPLTGNGSFSEGAFNGSAHATIPGVSDPVATLSGFSTEIYLGLPLHLYFATFGTSDDAGAPLHPAPSIDFSTMTADMTSLFAQWNGVNEFNVGGIATVTDLGANQYLLAWSKQQNYLPFLGLNTHITMTIQAVPIPASAWLFGSGLLGLAGIAGNKSRNGRRTV